MIIVLARSWKQFVQWQKEDLPTRKTAVYISDPWKLRGITGHVEQVVELCPLHMCPGVKDSFDMDLLYSIRAEIKPQNVSVPGSEA